MGQYHLICNPKKRQYLHPHRWNDGLKLLEFGASGSGTMMGLAVLLADSNGRGCGDLRSDSPLIGSWAGDPIVITGDYADEGRHVPPEDIRMFRDAMARDKDYLDWLHKKGLKLDEVVPNLYHVASTLYEDISDKVILALCDDPYERKALINRGAEAAKTWQPPPPKVDPFTIE